MKHIPWIIGVALLLILFGYWLATTYGIKQVDQRIIVIERPVEIKGKKEILRGERLPPSAKHINNIDSLIAEADKADSLHEFAETLAEPFLVMSVDTVEVSDSLGSFHAINIDSLHVFPLQKLVERTRSWEKAVLKTVNLETDFIRSEGWLDMLLGHPLVHIAFLIIGFVIGIGL